MDKNPSQILSEDIEVIQETPRHTKPTKTVYPNRPSSPRPPNDPEKKDKGQKEGK